MANLPTAEVDVHYFACDDIPDLAYAFPPGYEARLMEHVSYEDYIHLYREIGRDYIWNYRAGQSREEVEKILQSPKCRLHLLYHDAKPIGMAECWVEDAKTLELVHFGLLPAYVGKGLGKAFLAYLFGEISSQGFQRIHLSTCSWDHPNALSF